ncbi:MAG: methyltransferase [Nostoc sp. NMS1]|uniref:CmcJ/NvfI family oxidoreductase n=1 Tax=Nostoc sp. NMS1 TaxID=2815388 RepID=UPI0025D4AF53|nr:CmcJ/NvfI family oxidoreductase [Nostoc sp. NMS1]MBN3905507.1 methyltransferase [Nostoc sp. NMS1]
MSLDSSFLLDLPHVEAKLTYFTPMAEKPVIYAYEPPPGIPPSNRKFETHLMPIYNIRAVSQDISLDREGFRQVVAHSSVRNFYDEDEILRVYYPEAEQLLKEVTGVQKVVIFDHTLRNAQRSLSGESGISEPIKRVHNDVTAKSGYTRARKELTLRGIDNIDELLQQRFAFINIWRAFAPVYESPLAVCDAQSIAPTDLVASDLVYRDYVGESYLITYNPTHQWFYFPQMQPSEALLFKCFDSAEDGRARFPAHTAFDDPTSPPDAPARESLELRTLVFYPK